MRSSPRCAVSPAALGEHSPWAKCSEHHQQVFTSEGLYLPNVLHSSFELRKGKKQAVLCRIYGVTAGMEDSVPKQATERQMPCEGGIKESSAWWERQR